MIHISNLKKSYQVGPQKLEILKGISLDIEAGDFVAIMGPSGSGKSTLMNILGLLDVPSSGTYQLNNVEVSKLTEDELAIFRRKVLGFVFQQFHLLPRMTALENVSLPLIYSKNSSTKKEAAQISPLDLLKTVQLDDRAFHRPNELSGGQQQRVAIARALVNEPQIIFADEPTGNLDSTSQVEIMKALEDLNQKGITIIMVTHEEDVAAHAKRIIKVRDGLIQSDIRQKSFEKQLDQKRPDHEKNIDIQAATFLWTDILTHLQQGFAVLAANKIRTALSTLGIMIGVAAVVAMLAIGQGAQKQIEQQLSSLGSNLLILRTGAARVGGVAQDAGATTRLTPEDAQNLKTITTIKESAPQVNGRGQVTFQNKNWSTSVLGTTSSYAKMHAANPAIGRFFTDEEVNTRARVAVIGVTIQKELFGEQSPIGEMIKINKVNFQIVGILPEKGANGFRNQDDIIVMPYTTAMYRLLGKLYLDSIETEIDKPENISEAQDMIIKVMNEKHHVQEDIQQDTFQIFNMADVQDALSQTSKTMSMLLAAIAAISLVVGGIGIMNIMLVSVTERTREIGLRKAIGATQLDIRLQFLAESVVVSVVGGLFGILFGWLVTLAIALLSGWATSVSIQSVLLSFLFSGGIGVLFGVYPANKAARLNPIDALRYE